MSDLLQISFQAGGLAALVLLTNQVLSRWLPPKARYTLWFLVLFRLLLWSPLTDPFSMQRPGWWTWNESSSTTLIAIDDSETSASTPFEAPTGLIRIAGGESASKPTPVQVQTSKQILVEDEVKPTGATRIKKSATSRQRRHSPSGNLASSVGSAPPI